VALCRILLPTLHRSRQSGRVKIAETREKIALQEPQVRLYGYDLFLEGLPELGLRQGAQDRLMLPEHVLQDGLTVGGAYIDL
jgi:hypothetical protein